MPSMRITVETEFCEARGQRRLHNGLLGHISGSQQEGRYAKPSSLKAVAKIPTVTAHLQPQSLYIPAKSRVVRARQRRHQKRQSRARDWFGMPKTWRKNKFLDMRPLDVGFHACPAAFQTSAPRLVANAQVEPSGRKEPLAVIAAAIRKRTFVQS